MNQNENLNRDTPLKIEDLGLDNHLSIEVSIN